MAGMHSKRQWDGTRVYPTIGEVLETVWMDNIKVYITQLQKMVAQYIATHTIMELCLAAERNPVMRPSRQYWEQPTKDILGIRAGHAEAEVGGETGTEESKGDGEVE